MNKTTEEFLNEVCSFIKYKGIHNEVKEELSIHIDELADFYINQGLSDEEAIKRAVTDMGDANEIGQKLNKQHKPHTEWSIIFLTAVISLFGILVVYISRSYENYSVSFTKHIVHIALGIIVLTVTYFVDYIKLKKYPKVLFLSSVFLLIICYVFGAEVNGARRYIHIGSFAVSANAVSCILFVTSFCGFLEKYRGEDFFGIVKMVMWGFLSLLFYVLQPSLSTVIILFMAYSVVLLKAISKNHFEGNNKLQMIVLLSFGGVSAFVGVAFIFVQNFHRIEKIFLFLNKGASDPTNSGWIYQMADRLLKSSRLVGKAIPLPEGNINWVMPEITTDFVLLNFINTFGWIAGILLLTIIIFFIVKMFLTTKQIKNTFGFYLSLISCIMLTSQFVINVLMNLGMFPIVEMSLPFVSYGGSNYITNMIYVGLILSIHRKNNILSNTHININTKEKMITFVDNKLIIDFSANKENKV